MRRPAGFTLIEILIAVAILAILALIAVPNFLAAQTRAKVSRVRADLRALAAAIEAYSSDHNGPPLDWCVPRGDPMLPGMSLDTSGIAHPGYRDELGALHPGLTTPVAYIADCWMTDPFAQGSSYDAIPFDQQKYTYKTFINIRGIEPGEDYVLAGYAECYGPWYLMSMGPDRDIYNGGELSQKTRIYDPTNGAVSSGNIIRSQREAEAQSRPWFDSAVDE